MNKEIILRITHSKMDFTYVEEKIAEYFLGNNPILSTNELSKKLCVSPASITRFCKKIGLSNFKELNYLYSEHLKELDKLSISNIATDLHSSYIKIFSYIDNNFENEKIDEICKHIYENRFMHIFALGLSATAAQDFKFRFSRTGKLIEVIYDKDAIAMICELLKEGDLVFIFSLRGNKTLERYAESLKEKGVTIISITGNKNSKLVKLSDVYLLTANLEGEESTGMISAQIPILIQIDLIYYYYVRRYSDVLDQWISTEKVFVEKRGDRHD